MPPFFTWTTLASLLVWLHAHSCLSRVCSPDRPLFKILHWPHSVLRKQPKFLPVAHRPIWDLTLASLFNSLHVLPLGRTPCSLCSRHLVAMSVFLKHQVLPCLTAFIYVFSLPETSVLTSGHASSKSYGCHLQCHLRSHPRPV